MIIDAKIKIGEPINGGLVAHMRAIVTEAFERAFLLPPAGAAFRTTTTRTPPARLGAPVRYSKAFERVATLRKLERDWDEEGGAPPSATAITNAFRALSIMADAGAQGEGEPQVAPTSDGGIMLEWRQPTGELLVHCWENGRIEYLISRHAGDDFEFVGEPDDLQAVVTRFLAG